MPWIVSLLLYFACSLVWFALVVLLTLLSFALLVLLALLCFTTLWYDSPGMTWLVGLMLLGGLLYIAWLTCRLPCFASLRYTRFVFLLASLLALI